MIDVLGPEKHRRRITQEKIAILFSRALIREWRSPSLPGNMV